MKKFLILMLAMGVLLTAGLASVSAQEGGGRGGRGDLRGLVEIASEQTGLTPREIAQSLREGSSLAELIQSNGGDPQVLIDAAYAEALERIDQAEANGRISAERATEMRANALSRIEQAVNRELGEVRIEARLRGMAVRMVLELAAEQTGLSARELGAALRGGTSLADVLTENGVALDAFIAEATERADARLNVLVVDGRITAERAAELLGEFTTGLRERLSASATAAANA
jgi:hypothetical protein